MATALSLLVLTTLALALGGAYLWRRDGRRRHAALMLVLAMILAINVAIWAVPMANGVAPVTAGEAR